MDAILLTLVLAFNVFAIVTFLCKHRGLSVLFASLSCATLLVMIFAVSEKSIKESSLSPQATSVEKLLRHESIGQPSFTDIGTLHYVASTELGMNTEEIRIYLNPTNIFWRLGVVPTNFTFRQSATNK